MNHSADLSRRQFLRHASLVTAGALLPATQRAMAAPDVSDAL
ncbi:MAG: twin-arginine translocation signal domain-containing protein, partial [Verrucomicrobiae bacterium]|nr:twin-arginine translocation signal domain-containing protein [Verrucomicrobiae bacterium]